ncbi:hypothetical protein MTQ01_17115 [Streptomyces sp. XM4193]|uniref:hypothetical protein n=1 Tax=Streptomyces sp. XM4193 TaxID=2929782 RepID=UPI001FF72E3D|nr:hypothetical protein [Streptomyces sp. XM4193]MCK1797716.1 hypothetical protein [Streptomyces sp. XM4193]
MSPPGATHGETMDKQQTAPALELMVHGVGGATPQDVLDDPRTVLVTGDATAGIHRRADDEDAEERPEDYRDGPIREAYCWSGLTSGNGARALWLVLLPFMIANLAYWMRPAAPLRHPAQRLYSAIARLLALSLTVLLTAAVCELALDLVAWQCAGSAACAEGSSWLSFMAVSGEGWWSVPGRRLALAALLPLLVTLLLWWLSHRTWSAYESASPPPRRPGTVHTEPGEEPPPLSLPGFWYGRRLVSRLRAAHTTAGLLTIATALSLATRHYDAEAGGARAVIGQLLLVLCAGLWCAAVLAVVRRGRTEREADEHLDPAVTRLLPCSALALLALIVAHAAWDRPGWESAGALPGTGVFSSLALLQGALLTALAVTALVLNRAARPADRSAMGGLGGVGVALIGCGIGQVLTGGLAQRISEWLATGSTVGDSELIAGPPVVLVWQAAVIPLVLLSAVVFLLVSAVRVMRLRKRLTPGIVDGYPGETTELPTRSGQIAGTISRAGLTDSTPVLIGAITVLSLVLGAGAVAGALISGESPGQAAVGAPAPLPALGALAEGVGSWLMGALVILLVAMGRQAYRDPGARRTVGILWDVGTFWPRGAHPFAPPCYAERAVPDLSWRIGTWTELTGGRLVLSGHSQGSVLAAAAVWQLDPATRSRVALLTHGSPLERLYGRWFPQSFGPTALHALHREVEGWRNLWRLTDPIGGPVKVYADGPRVETESPPTTYTGEVDRGPLKDPLTYGRTLRHPLPSPILGHADYHADPAFDEERDRLLASVARPHEHVGEPGPKSPATDGGPGDARTADAGGPAGAGGPVKGGGTAKSGDGGTATAVDTDRIPGQGRAGRSSE